MGQIIGLEGLIKATKKGEKKGSGKGSARYGAGAGAGSGKKAEGKKGEGRRSQSKSTGVSRSYAGALGAKSAGAKYKPVAASKPSKPVVVKPKKR